MRRFVALALTSTLALQAAPLAAAPAKPGARAGGAQAPVSTGGISGTARSAANQPLPKHTVQLRNLETGRLVATATSGADGAFSFAGLAPGNYVVEIVNELGVLVGSSGSIPVIAGTTATVTVLATALTAAAAGGAGVSTALIITTIAAAAGIAGVIVVNRDDASPNR